MAREVTNRPKRFSLEKSDAIEENDRILESGSQQRLENREKKNSGGEVLGGASSDLPLLSSEG